MFNLSSSSSDEGQSRTKVITIAYTEVPCYGNARLDSTIEESTSESSNTLPTPSILGSAGSLLDHLEEEQKKEEFFGYHPIWRQMSMSDGIKMQTLEYFWDCKIFQLFDFMMTHLLAHTPEDPVSFLLSLVDRCIRYRDEDGEPPLIFEDSHIHSVYVAMDPLLEGSISYSQYITGMQTLGLTEFNVMPNDLDENMNVAKDNFIAEAKKALIIKLDFTLGKSRNVNI